jgi:hypothetical protein
MVTRDDHYHAVKVAVDTISAMFALGTLLNWLPAIAAGLSIIWYCIRIYEYFRQRRLEKRSAHG